MNCCTKMLQESLKKKEKTHRRKRYNDDILNAIQFQFNVLFIDLFYFIFLTSKKGYYQCMKNNNKFCMKTFPLYSQNLLIQIMSNKYQHSNYCEPVVSIFSGDFCSSFKCCFLNISNNKSVAVGSWSTGVDNFGFGNCASVNSGC